MGRCSGPAVDARCPFAFLSARRGWRCAASAHTGAVFASLRLRCAARPEVAPKNSRRSLRSLWSNSFGESVLDARCARRPQACAAHRSTVSRRRTAPAAKATSGGSRPRTTTGSAKARPGRGQRACVALRSTGLAARARSVLRALTRRNCLTKESAASGGSFSTGPQDRAPQGSRCIHRPPQWRAGPCPGAPLLRLCCAASRQRMSSTNSCSRRCN